MKATFFSRNPPRQREWKRADRHPVIPASHAETAAPLIVTPARFPGEIGRSRSGDAMHTGRSSGTTSPIRGGLRRGRQCGTSTFEGVRRQREKDTTMGPRSPTQTRNSAGANRHRETADEMKAKVPIRIETFRTQEQSPTWTTSGPVRAPRGVVREGSFVESNNDSDGRPNRKSISAVYSDRKASPRALTPAIWSPLALGPGARRPECSLIIPAHNEAHRLGATLHRYSRALDERYGENFEILVVANGCSDQTSAVASSLVQEIPQIRVIDVPEAVGKGGAVLRGFRQAGGARVLFADADGSTDPASLIALADELDDHDVAIGSRRLPESTITNPQPPYRRFLSRCFRLAVHGLFPLPYQDTQCGAKAVRGDVVSRLVDAVHETGWAFDVDLLLSARTLGLDIVEDPVVWSDSGESSLRILPTVRQVGPALWRLKRRQLQHVEKPQLNRLVILAPPTKPVHGPLTSDAERTRPLRILALNWRCFRHPEAGGAEVNIFEQAERWVRAGHRVTIFSADPGRQYAPSRTELFNGVEVRRKGGRFTVYLHAALFLLRHGWSFDRIVDVENGIPFFAPLFTNRPGVLLVHHVHDRQWFTEFPGIAGRCGRFLECRVMPVVYRRWPVIAVSPTTAEALARLGFNSSRISVIYNGTRLPKLALGQQAPKSGHIAYVGRLKRYKRLDRLVEATADLCPEFPDVHLDIAGDGDAREEIEATVDRLNLRDHVTLFGFVDEATKADILSSAVVFATPSMQEGWGLSVIEANAYGCPAVAYDVPGLRVAIRNGETGLLAKDDDEFRKDLGLLLRDPQLRSTCSVAARRWAERFDWDYCAGQTLELITACGPTKPFSVAHHHRSLRTTVNERTNAIGERIHHGDHLERQTAGTRSDRLRLTREDSAVSATTLSISESQSPELCA